MKQYIPDSKTWKTPYIYNTGFVFEVQVLLYKPYVEEKQKQSIKNLGLGEYKKIECPVKAEEWGNTFFFGEHKGFANKEPSNRQEALDILKEFLDTEYIKGGAHPWESITGHLQYQHYAGEMGFDVLGVEIGEVVNSYQMHIAFTRGAAKQFGTPWLVDFSPWLNDGMLDYSGERVWGDSSGANKGHSVSLHERSYYMSYMSGANWIIAEAGGINFFYPKLDADGNYFLTPLGKAGQKFNEFTINNSDIGIPYTPFGILLDYYHGTYYGSDYPKRAFETFPYNEGDNLTWSILDKFFPDSWKQWERKEKNALTNSPYGDTCDVIMQNAPQEILNSYPAIILSGDIRFSEEETGKIITYIMQGGTAIINTAYLKYFPEIIKSDGDNTMTCYLGKGKAIVYGPDYCSDRLDAILNELTAKYIPFTISGNIEYLMNVKKDSIILTIINNDGVLKPVNEPVIIDQTKNQFIEIVYKGDDTIKWVKDLRTGKMMATKPIFTVNIEPGDFNIIEFGF